jgi:hypothetical protein
MPLVAMHAHPNTFGPLVSRLLVIVTALWSVACVVQPVAGENGELDPQSAADAGMRPGGDAGARCTPKGGIDPALFPRCCMVGRARCIPRPLVGGEDGARLQACAGGYCVPEPIIRGGDSYRPTRCQSVGNIPGACVSVCVPQVQMSLDILPRGTCAEDERCSPCVDPRTGQPTGACEPPSSACGSDGRPVQRDAGGDAAPLTCPHVGPPVLDPSAFPACPCGGTRCLPAALVEPGQRTMLAACDGGFCVPEDFVRTGGRFVPPTCQPFSGQGEGRCLSNCIPMVRDQSSQLERGSCGEGQSCVPCWDPRTGMSTGACNQSCDRGPSIPPYTFGSCCGGRAKCIPNRLVPEGQRAQLEQKDCASSFLCVPTENIDPGFRGPACSASALLGSLLGGRPYQGVCVSTCVKRDFFTRLGTAQGNCPSTHFCAPCRHPLTGAATGAPGC